jgi:long-subunit fatty acid transport protein
MKLSLFSIIALFALAFTTTVCAQEQGLIFDFFSGGARSEGMGQAYLALANDVTAGSSNPAGLYVHEKTIMTFSYGTFAPRGTFTYLVPSNPQTQNHAGNFGSLNYLGLVSPIRIKGHHIVFNLGYNRNFDTYFKFGEQLYNWSEPLTSLERRGGVSNINLGIGTRIYQKLSFGLNCNIYDGRVISEEHRELYREMEVQGLISTAKALISIYDSTSYSGFNATLGFLYLFSDKLRGGLTIRTPFDLKGKSDSTTFRISTLRGITIDGMTDTVYVNNKTSRIQMPLMLGFGLAYNIADDFLVSGDVEYRAFSGKKIKNLDSLFFTAGGDRIEEFGTTDPHWSNVMQFRLGTEYLLKTKFGEIPLRAGFRNEAFPWGNIANYTITYGAATNTSLDDSLHVVYSFDYDTKKVTGSSVSFGTGIHWSQIQLDVAYTYTGYEQKIYHNSVLTAENKWKNHHLNFSFTGYF